MLNRIRASLPSGCGISASGKIVSNLLEFLIGLQYTAQERGEVRKTLGEVEATLNQHKKTMEMCHQVRLALDRQDLEEKTKDITDSVADKGTTIKKCTDCCGHCGSGENNDEMAGCLAAVTGESATKEMVSAVKDLSPSQSKSDIEGCGPPNKDGWGGD